MNEQNDVTSTETPATVVAKVLRKVGRPVDPNSKLAKAKSIYAELIGRGIRRKDILEALETQVGCTPGTAAMYYHKAKNESKAS